MNTRAKAIFAIAVVIAFLPLASAFGNTPNASNSSNAASDIVPNAGIGFCPTQAFLTKPSGPKVLVLSITWTITNDEDSGISGYWALDHFSKTTLKVWSLQNGSFYVLRTYNGKFSTPQGAISPGIPAVTESESAFGTIKGGYVATFTGQFTPGANPTTGSIGTKDYGGSVADVLLGTYGNGPQTGSTSAYDWTSVYFTNVNSVEEPGQIHLTHWGWAYELNAHLQSLTSTNEWCNYNLIDGGNSGDIST